MVLVLPSSLHYAAVIVLTIFVVVLPQTVFVSRKIEKVILEYN